MLFGFAQWLLGSVRSVLGFHRRLQVVADLLLGPAKSDVNYRNERRDGFGARTTDYFRQLLQLFFIQIFVEHFLYLREVNPSDDKFAALDTNFGYPYIPTSTSSWNLRSRSPSPAAHTPHEQQVATVGMLDTLFSLRFD